MDLKFLKLMEDLYQWLGDLPASTSGASDLHSRLEDLFKDYEGLEHILDNE